MSSSETGRPERRRYARTSANETKSLTLRLPNGVIVTIVARLIDVSEHGVGFAHWGDLPAGSPVLLHDATGPNGVLYVVRNARPLRTGGFHVGAERVCVVKPLPSDANVGGLLNGNAAPDEGAMGAKDDFH